MRKVLYTRLAATNLKKNHVFYTPYLLTCVITVMTFCIMLTLQRDEALGSISGGMQVKTSLGFGCIVIAIFAFIILLYTNGVLIKSRKKEFGLYNILGMEKRQIGRVLRWETVYTAAIGLAGGLVSSVVLSKLLQLLLMRILNCDVKFALTLDPGAMGATAALFLVIFAVLYLRTARIVRIANPAELLQGSSEGEREPKSKWGLAIAGLICLGGGYAMSIMTRSAIDAIALFFIAVLLVIAGTYMLFTSFSIVLLKALRKNKRYYYKTKHFATVSGMLYRMKRNAAGLASICILSTMVLVTVSTTSCLYLGVDSMIEGQYPYDVNVMSYGGSFTEEDIGGMRESAEKFAEAYGVELRDYTSFSKLEFAAVYENGELALKDNDAEMNSIKDAVMLWFVTTEDYESMTGSRLTLEPGQLGCYTDGIDLGGRVELAGESYELIPIESFPLDSGYRILDVNTAYLIADSAETLEALDAAQRQVYGENASETRSYLYFNLTGSDETKIAFANDFESEVSRSFFERDYGARVTSRQRAVAEDVFSFYGVFFFLGMFLGIIFVLATVLIIYYKQVSEGYEDRSRFEIMQKVGMTQAEVRGTIHQQVLIVFFLPLFAAAMHIIFAFPMIRYILSAFSMNDLALFVSCVAGAFAIFAALYFLIYTSTSRTYYRIVSGRAN